MAVEGRVGWVNAVESRVGAGVIAVEEVVGSDADGSDEVGSGREVWLETLVLDCAAAVIIEVVDDSRKVFDLGATLSVA